MPLSHAARLSRLRDLRTARRSRLKRRLRPESLAGQGTCRAAMEVTDSTAAEMAFPEVLGGGNGGGPGVAGSQGLNLITVVADPATLFAP
jgi:hypothetical protein